MRKSKKLLISFLLSVIIFNFVSTVFAASLKENTKILDDSINSGAVLIMEASTGKIIYEKNGFEIKYPASTTKIMTAILSIENCKLDEKAVASEYAITSLSSGASVANIQVGEELTVEDLLYALMICSANESAIVLAEHVAGTEADFCKLMNSKAKELGCQNTHFVNTNGLHDEDHYSTAYDLALIAQYAMKNETFRKIVSTTSFTLPATNIYPKEDRTFTNTNSLIIYDNRDRADNYYYEYATGIKTGFTTPARNCLVSSAKKNGIEYINVVLDAPVSYNETGSVSHRYLDTISLFEFAFNNYSFRKINDTNSFVESVKIDNADNEHNSLSLLVKDELTALVSIDNKTSTLEPKIELNPDLSAPIKKGDVVGKITYEVEGSKYSSDLLAGNDVEVLKEYDYKIIIIPVGIAAVLVVIIIIKIFRSKMKYTRNKNKYKKV